MIQKFLSHEPDELCISSITYAELMHGVEKSPIAVLDFGSLAAEEYGKIRAELERKGTPIGSMDLLIAGHAKSENLILVTNHTREFVRVEGLKLEDWASSR